MKILKWSNDVTDKFDSMRPLWFSDASFPQNAFVQYAIDVVDVIYIRRKFRRRGLATRCLDDVISRLPPGCLIGFSEPISDALLKGSLRPKTTIYYAAKSSM